MYLVSHSICATQLMDNLRVLITGLACLLRLLAWFWCPTELMGEPGDLGRTLTPALGSRAMQSLPVDCSSSEQGRLPLTLSSVLAVPRWVFILNFFQK